MKVGKTMLHGEDLLRAFEDGTVSPSEWDHRAHVTTAYLLMRRCDLSEAVARMRAGLLQLAAKHQIPHALDRGYHETITIAWMRIVAALISSHEDGDTSDAEEASEDDGSKAFLTKNSFLLDKSLLRLYYTRGRLFTVEAKQAFVAPDIAALPAIGALRKRA
jgi:hypothetical protein